MKRRNVIAVVLTVILILGVIASAGAEKKKLTWTICCSQTDRHQLFGSIADAYNATHPDVEVEWVYPNGWYTQVLKTWIAGGTPADVMWIGTASEFENLVLPLNDLVAKDKTIGSIHPAILKMGEWDGQQLAIPYGANTHPIAYNKNMFAAAGLAYPTADWTWDEAIQMAKRMTVDANGDGTPEQYGLNITEMVEHPFTYGGDAYDASGRTLTVNNKPNAEALQMYADWSAGKTSYFAPGTPKFTAGKIGMQNLGIFNVPGFKQADFDWDIVPLPGLVVDGKRYNTTFMSVEGWMVAKDTKYPQEAKEFVQYLLSPPVMQKIAKAGIVVPGLPQLVSEDFTSLPAPPANMTAFLQSLNYGHIRYLFHPAGRDIYDQWRNQDIWKQMWAGETPASIVLPELQRQGQAILDEYWTSRK